MVTVHIAMHSIRPMGFRSKNQASVGTLFKDQPRGMLQMENRFNYRT